MSDTLLQFHAEWCGPCKKVTPVLEKIAEAEDVSLVRTDVDMHPTEAAAWNVKGVPTIIRLDDSGQETHRVVGAKPLMALRRDLGFD